MFDERGKASSLIKKKAKAYENKLEFFVATKAAPALQYGFPWIQKILYAGII